MWQVKHEFNFYGYVKATWNTWSRGKMMVTWFNIKKVKVDLKQDEAAITL